MAKTLGFAMIAIVAGWCALAAGGTELSTKPATQPSTQPAKELVFDLGNKVTMKLALIPAGKFTMGSPAGEKDRFKEEGPQHEVTISKPFYMGVYTVTQAQWQAVMGTTVSQQRDKVNKDLELLGDGEDHPMCYVNWNEAAQFCTALSKKTGKTVRLPTEAQWEYACRAGSKTRFSYGDDDDYAKLGDYAWYVKNRDGKNHPVGQKKPNDWGLYDMYGNVWQWCADWFASYTNASTTDPAGPASGSWRVLRGCGSASDPRYCRSAYRSACPPVPADFTALGFRVIVELN